MAYLTSSREFDNPRVNGRLGPYQSFYIFLGLSSTFAWSLISRLVSGSSIVQFLVFFIKCKSRTTSAFNLLASPNVHSFLIDLRKTSN